MIAFNLLPWREALARKQKRCVIQMIVITIVLVFVMMWVFSHALDCWVEAKRKIVLSQEKTWLKIKKNNQHNKTPKNNLSPELARDVSDYIYEQQLMLALDEKPSDHICLTSVIEDNHQLSVSGYARSAETLRDFIAHWPASSLFHEIILSKMEWGDTHPQQKEIGLDNSESSQMSFTFEAHE